MKSFSRILLTMSWMLSFGCAPFVASSAAESLTSINIIDHNGLSQTISSKQRLKQYQAVDFLKPHPYQKVMRIYSRNRQGNQRAIITSYHPNGEVKQYLEVVNGRACGWYREWFPCGLLRLEARVVGGCADINSSAEKSWIFDQTSRAWHEDGHLAAEIHYDKGALHGTSIYYHPNGRIWKQEPYHHNNIEGCIEIFLDSGELLQSSQYRNGQPHGSSVRYWYHEDSSQTIAAEESFHEGKMVFGRYYDIKSRLIAQIDNGSGFRALFGKEGVCEIRQYQNGVPDGKIQIFSPEDGVLEREYHIKDNIKHGEEVVYSHFLGKPPLPQMSLHWHQGKVQGIVKTWYNNGQLESQKEISDNRKHGLSTVWYDDGCLMMIEEYESDKLINGEYHNKTDSRPVSRVIDGKGFCTIFSADGSFLRKIEYSEGIPVR